MAAGASDAIANMPTMASPTSPAVASSSSNKEEEEEAKNSLVTLPEELVSNIAVKLGSDDLFNLRLTCRDLEAKSLHEFATEYLSAKCFMFTSESLKTLVNIAKSEKLRHYLQKVYIITASVTDRQLNCCNHDTCVWKPGVREREAFIFYKDDQARLRKDRTDKALLVEAFSALPRLQQLLLIDSPKALPSSVKCHGLAKFRRTTGITPHYRPVDEAFATEYYPWLTHVFRMMMFAIAESGINTLTHLITNLNPSMESLYGISPATDFYFKPSMVQKLSKAFCKLQHVNLSVRSRCLRPGKQESSRDLERAAQAIKDFAPALKNVSDLCLTFDLGPTSGNLLRMFAKNTKWSSLTKVTLDGVLVDMNTLAGLVCGLSSAEMITLTLVEIKDGSWPPILKALQKLPKLNHLHMQYLQVDGQKCLFLEMPDDDDAYEEELGMAEPPWLNSLIGDYDQTYGTDDEGSEWSDADDDDDDEDVPDLLDLDGTAIDRPPVDAPTKKKAKSKAPAETKPSRNACPMRTDKNYRTKGVTTGERGYNICLEGQEEIQEQLPIFIKEYNIGGQVPSYEDMALNGLLGNLPPLPAGAGGLGGVFTMAIPAAVPGQPPAPAPGAQAQQGQQAPQAGAGAAAGTAPAGPANMPPLPPLPPGLGGLFSLFGAYPTQAPPPAPGAAPAAPTANQAQGSATQTAATAATGTNDEEEDDQGWWENSEEVHGELDDVD